MLPLILALAQALLVRAGHAAADGPLHRLAGGNVHRQVHPQQHLPGVEGPGLGAAQPGSGQHRPPLGEAGGLRLTGEGQAHLHPPQATAPLGLVEDGGPHHACHLGHPLPGLLAAEGGLAAYVHNAQNVRAGVGYDALQGLLLAQGHIRHRVVVDNGIPFKFHVVRSLVIVSAWLC